MKAYLVQARKRRVDSLLTDYVIYVAAFQSQGEAIEAVATMLAPGEVLEFVIGTASDALIHVMQLRPGMVEVLA